MFLLGDLLARMKVASLTLQGHAVWRRRSLPSLVLTVLQSTEQQEETTLRCGTNLAISGSATDGKNPLTPPSECSEGDYTGCAFVRTWFQLVR